jgi:thiol:disulfide interchange protein DsbC
MRKIIVGLMCGLLGMQVALADDADIMQVKKALESVAPGAKADSITATSLPGLYEVMVGTEIVYISKDGRYMLQGDLVDLQTQKNLTEAKRGTGRLKLVNAVSESAMIVFSPKKQQVKHTITVFTDVDCSYCRKMHSEMAEINRLGIKVRYLMFPRTGKNSPSYDKAVSVFCAKDRNAALTRAKATGNIEKKTCVNPVDQHMALVERLGLTGTPTLMMEDGRLLPGYMPAQRLSALLDEPQS